MKPKYWLLLGVAAVGGAQAAACSSISSSCTETRSCAASEAGAAQGEAGEAGAPAAGGGSADAEGGEGGAAGGSALNRGPVLLGSCATLGTLACRGVASAQRLACDGSKWQPGTTCADGELCDSGSGECAKQIAQCVGAKPGQGVCREDTPLTCGPDLVSATEGQACAGLCKGGVCQAPACGDKKLEAGEDCDDGDTTGAGACVKCKAATCGDGAVYAGHEECDDGNTAAGDGCSSTCTWEPIAIAAGAVSTCALSKNGAVKCWGDNTHGELGIETTINHGVTPEDLGAALPAVSLGAQRTAKVISVGSSAACAILDNGDLKCWGDNEFGQLGQTGSAGPELGGRAGQMGDNLLPIALGAGRTASAVSQRGSHTCAVLDDGELKCWGSGSLGQLGQDSDVAYTSPPSAAINLGGKASAVSAGPNNTTCALLANGEGKCWGLADFGALSVAASANKGSAVSSGSSVAIGDYPGEMALLPGLSFGLGLTAKQIATGYWHTCALLSNNTVKCWGLSYGGELGLGIAQQQAGNNPDALAALPPIDLGSGRTVQSIAVGYRHVCAILDGGDVKCWGENEWGQLGLGLAVMDGRGDSANEMGDNLPIVPLGHKALQLAAGDSHTCALLDNGTVVCWGYNAEGELGIGNTEPLGNLSPVAFKAVNLAF